MLESGNIIVVYDDKSTARKEFIVEKVGERIMLAEPSQPYQRLHVVAIATNPTDSLYLTVQFSCGTPQSNNTFKLEEVDGKYMLVCSVKIGKDRTECGLAITPDGTLAAVKMPYASDTMICQFYISRKLCLGSEVLEQPIAPICHKFSKWEMRRFLHEGYLIINSVIPNSVTSKCIADLNHELGKPGRVIDGGVQDRHRLGKLAGELSNGAAVRAVFRGEAQGIADALFGRDGYEASNLSAQIAFRFPEPQGPAHCEEGDGLVWHTDGLRQGHSHGFSVLLGVCLSDVTEENQGNLTVWPGSHLLLHQCKVPPHGALDLAKVAELTASAPHFDNFRCPSAAPLNPTKEKSYSAEPVPVPAAHHDNEPDLPGLGEPLQLRMKTGDVVILHPDLAHTGAPNWHCEVRRMLYYRLKIRTQRKSTDCENADFGSWEEVVRRHESDMWVDLPGVRSCLGAELGAVMRMYESTPTTHHSAVI